MSDFLYELSYLIHRKHFIDVFSPIIVTATSRNINFFVLMKIKNFKYFTFLMSKSFTMNHSMKLRAQWKAFPTEFLKNFILWQHETLAEKMCQILISHNSTQFGKWNICIVCCITNHQNSCIFKFILYQLQR